MNMLSKTIALSSVLMLCGCQLVTIGIPGSGTIVSETRDVDTFSEVSFSGAGELEIVAGTEVSTCEIECDDNLMEYIKTEVVDGRLKIWTTENVASTKGVFARIGTNKLSKVSISGSAEADISGLNEESLEVRISGSGDIVCEGTSQSFKAVISGSGSIKTAELIADDVDIQISGSGSANVLANKKLNVRVSGSGDVQYAGSPEVEQSISGSGSVRKSADTDSTEK